MCLQIISISNNSFSISDVPTVRFQFHYKYFQFFDVLILKVVYHHLRQMFLYNFVHGLNCFLLNVFSKLIYLIFYLNMCLPQYIINVTCFPLLWFDETTQELVTIVIDNCSNIQYSWAWQLNQGLIRHLNKSKRIQSFTGSTNLFHNLIGRLDDTPRTDTSKGSKVLIITGIPQLNYFAFFSWLTIRLEGPKYFVWLAAYFLEGEHYHR